MDSPIKYGLKQLGYKFNSVHKLIKMLVIIVSQIKRFDICPELFYEFVDYVKTLDITDPKLLLSLWYKFKKNKAEGKM